ncbi:MAG: CCA tRNA nucleotidyltransferase [Desulfuromonadaceae bacterium]|nr:CCA tRNA nucleotidyltransferase [Desulfuromonadaceae bacterium]
MKQKLDTLISHDAGLRWLAEQASPSDLRFYLVGGAVRDACLGREAIDYDLVSAVDPTDWARQLARHFGGHWFWLDATRRYSRVLLPGEKHYDFSPFRADTLEQDLRARDFSINAMAFPLSCSGRSGELFDPLAAREDLRNRRLRFCAPTAFRDDPLRILKGIRHSAVLGFDFDPATLAACEQARLGLEDVAGERIRSELAMIFSTHYAGYQMRALQSLVACSALEALLPDPDGRLSSEALTASTAFGERIDDLAAGSSFFSQRLQDAAGDEFTIGALFRFVAFLQPWHGVGPLFDRFLQRLKPSRQLAQGLTFCLAAPRAGLPSTASSRQRVLFYQQQNWPIPLALIRCALGADNEMRQVLSRAWRYFEEKQQQGRLLPLVRGAELCQRWPQLQGKDCGELLNQLILQEINGTVRTRDQAWSYLAQQVKSH